jgi:glucose-6-phosphate 1-dehydrogenase
LNRELLEVLDESQIYRIDHYLGKETVQNILVVRFANAIFEPIWNRRYVDHVQITVSEQVGVGTRGGYYEEAGALRDMVPNHLFQLLALIAMEPPISFDAEAVRNEKAKIFRAIKPIAPDDVLNVGVRGQYGEGQMPSGEQAPGYRMEPKVPADATTETYVALKLMVDNWRWADVPFYLRTGKRLPARYTEIAIRFKRGSRTSSCCAFSRTKGSRSRSGPRYRAHFCKLATSTWISATSIISMPSRPPATRRCSSTA